MSGGIDQYTVTVLHMDGEDNGVVFYDNWLDAWDDSTPETATAYGNACTSTSASKFGGSALKTVATTDYISRPNSARYDLGYTDWTVDMWARYEGSSSEWYVLCTNIGAGAGWALEYCPSSDGYSNFYFHSYSSTGEALLFHVTTTPTISQSAWFHIAYIYYDDTPYIALNGVVHEGVLGIDSNTDDYSSTEPLKIGTGPTGWDEWHNGFIDEFRISTGVARWTSDFTPPTSPYNCLDFSTTEFLNIVDENTDLLLFGHSVSDSLVVKDKTYSDVILVIQETFNIAEAPAAQLCLLIQDFLQVLEVLDALHPGALSISESLSLFDSMSASLVLSVSDSVALSESSFARLELLLAEFVLIEDLIATKWNTTRTVDDEISLVDSVLSDIEVLITDSLALTDEQVAQLQISLLEFLTFLEDFTPNLNTTRTLTENLTLIDYFLREQLLLSLTESLVLTDTQIAVLSLALDDFFSSNDSVAHSCILAREVTDSLTINEFLYQQLTLFLEEALAISESEPLCALGLAILEYLGFDAVVSAIGRFSGLVEDSFSTEDSTGFGYGS